MQFFTKTSIHISQSENDSIYNILCSRQDLKYEMLVIQNFNHHICYNCYVSLKGKPLQLGLSTKMSEKVFKNNAAKCEE